MLRFVPQGTRRSPRNERRVHGKKKNQPVRKQIGVAANVEITSLISHPTWIQFVTRYDFLSTLKKKPPLAGRKTASRGHFI
jgi:hypothetical protein